VALGPRGAHGRDDRATHLLRVLCEVLREKREM